jgi:hypothetical protein
MPKLIQVTITEDAVALILEYQEMIGELYALAPKYKTEASSKLQAAFSEITGFNPYDPTKAFPYQTKLIA